MRLKSSQLNWKLTVVATLTLALHAQQIETLKITVLEGQGSVNSIKKSQSCRIVVEVRDETDRIVPTARVQFSTPATGPSGEVGGAHTFLAWTDTEGRAHVDDLVPNAVPGSFPVTVEARFAGRVGSATFNEENSASLTQVARTYTVNKPNHKVRNILIVAGIVGAAALAIGLSLALTGGGSTAVVPTPTTVSVGGISVGGPK